MATGLPRNRITMRLPGGAEGEGFEPSSDLTARNGFRDRHEHPDLQAVCVPFASLFASQPCTRACAFAELTTRVDRDTSGGFRSLAAIGTRTLRAPRVLIPSCVSFLPGDL